MQLLPLGQMQSREKILISSLVLYEKDVNMLISYFVACFIYLLCFDYKIIYNTLSSILCASVKAGAVTQGIHRVLI